MLYLLILKCQVHIFKLTIIVWLFLDEYLEF